MGSAMGDHASRAEALIASRAVGIVGLGNVGTAAAYALFARHTVSELVLVDHDAKRAEGEAMDLAHGQSFAGRIRVRAGGYPDLARAEVIIVAAGVAQKPGETRLDLLNRNASVFREIASELDRYAPNAVLVVATNPVDVLTYVLQELTLRPRNRVLGTGTMLDTARLRERLGEHFDVSPKSVHAYVLGEHGDSEVAIWSNATLGGCALRGTTLRGKALDRAGEAQMLDDVRRAAYRIIERKGYTNLAIGLVLARLVELVVDDQKAIVPVSVRVRGEYGIDGVCLSVPAVVGKDGVEEIVPPALDDDELSSLRRSADVLRESLRGIELPPPRHA